MELNSRIEPQAAPPRCAAMPDLLTVAQAHVEPMPVGERRSLLLRWADRIERRSEAMARVITTATGKPISLSRAEVARGLVTMRSTVDACRLLEPATIALDGAGTAVLHRMPAGPVLAVTPFNFPLNLSLHKLAPALAAGCPVLWKPSPKAPGVAELALELLEDAGAEPGLVQIAALSNEQTAHVAADPRLAVLSFTGSVAVGWQLRAAATRARCILELGSTSAVILDQVAPAEVAAVAQQVAWGATAHAGQSCISVQRIFVPVDRPDLIDALTAAFAAVPSGDPDDAATVCGPLIDDEAVARVSDLLLRLQQCGGRVLTGGRWCTAPEYPAGTCRCLLPTLIDGVKAHLPMVHSEEYFAPIATVHRYDDLAQALDAVELSPLGINAGIYSHDPQAIAQAFQQIAVGTLIVNDIPTRRDDRLPYGGVKNSGLGREGTLDGVLDYTQAKVLWQPHQ